MRKYTLLIGFLFTITSFLHAQAPLPGNLKLNNQSQVDGVVDINSFINSAIVTTLDERQLTYHASMIEEITTIDECDRQRTFRSFDYRSNRFFDRMEKKLFQVVSDGSITLLRRVFEYDIFDADDEYAVEEWYYVENGKVERIRNFRRQVLPLMVDYEEKMQEFRKLNKLRNLNNDLSMYLMVSYYNRLRSLEEQSLLSQR
ncbi:hypothetical protein [Tunicatimonas pelagia]|uniref:hypothetical protein n=1 Tax=Tunicatimonas pelagia TaxID=931531 RepID=UPI002666B57D|nr:hypothetical protein [Tunicatimonas pelagia]WKN42731.1 hypothetical protein P0M28_27210 [Tunicatimonas pelagia]